MAVSTRRPDGRVQGRSWQAASGKQSTCSAVRSRCRKRCREWQGLGTLRLGRCQRGVGPKRTFAGRHWATWRPRSPPAISAPIAFVRRPKPVRPNRPYIHGPANEEFWPKRS